jgi:very-short-patch-repair endonuclease
MATNREKIQQSKEKHEPIVEDFLKSECDSLLSYCTGKGYSPNIYRSLYVYIKKYRSDISLNISNNGKTIRHKSHLQKRLSQIPSKDTLIRLYENEKRLMKDIAREFGVSCPTVCYWFKRYGIEARSKSEVNSMRMTDEARDHLRKLANSGRIGVFSNDKKWRNGIPTWIELSMMRWLDSNKIKYETQWQFEPSGHRYDFRLTDYKLLIETDGVFFHNREKQKSKDVLHEKEANDRGFCVIRFTDKQIKESKEECFKEIHYEIQRKINE